MVIERIRKWNLLFTLGLGARSAAELLENLEEAGQEVPDWLPGEAVRYQAWRARKDEEKTGRSGGGGDGPVRAARPLLKGVSFRSGWRGWSQRWVSQMWQGGTFRTGVHRDFTSQINLAKHVKSVNSLETITCAETFPNRSHV